MQPAAVESGWPSSSQPAARTKLAGCASVPRPRFCAGMHTRHYRVRRRRSPACLKVGAVLGGGVQAIAQAGVERCGHAGNASELIPPQLILVLQAGRGTGGGCWRVRKLRALAGTRLQGPLLSTQQLLPTSQMELSVSKLTPHGSTGASASPAGSASAGWASTSSVRPIWAALAPTAAAKVLQGFN